MGDRILCLDFDGVIHSYTSGWKGADVIPDPIVPGTIEFIMEAQAAGWKIAIFSSRTNQPGGLAAMQDYMKDRYGECCRAGKDEDVEMWWASYKDIDWPTEKPPAVITLDDRALTFDGVWPSMEFLKNFKPWYKQEPTNLDRSEHERAKEVFLLVNKSLGLRKVVVIGERQDNGDVDVFSGSEMNNVELFELLRSAIIGCVLSADYHPAHLGRPSSIVIQIPPEKETIQ